jgi:hypothetical protein
MLTEKKVDEIGARLQTPPRKSLVQFVLQWVCQHHEMKCNKTAAFAFIHTRPRPDLSILPQRNSVMKQRFTGLDSVAVTFICSVRCAGKSTLLSVFQRS